VAVTALRRAPQSDFRLPLIKTGVRLTIERIEPPAGRSNRPDPQADRTDFTRGGSR
jgi:hypothetical protein